MKKNCIFVCVILGLVTALFAGAAVVSFVLGGSVGVAPGVAACLLALIAAWVFAGYLRREIAREKFIARYRVRDYEGAKAVLDKAAGNHFLYPFMRIALNQMYLRVELCLDDVPAAVKGA